MYNRIDFHEEFNIGSLLKLYWLHIKFISIFVVVAVALIIAYSYSLPARFETSATLVPPEESGSSGFSSYLQSLPFAFNLGGGASKSQLFTEFMKSREVARIIADTLKLKDHPWFKKASDNDLYSLISSSIDVSTKKTGALQITASVSTPSFPNKKDKIEAASLAAKIANAAISGLDRLNRDKSTSKAKRKRIFIEKVLAQKKHELDSVDLALEYFQKENKVLSLDNQAQNVVNNAASIGADLRLSEIELALKKQDYDPSSPVIKALLEKISNLREQYTKSQRGGLVSNDDITIPVLKVPELARIYTNLIRDQKILEQVNLYLETQKYSEAIQEESDMPTVERLDMALPLDNQVEPNKRFMVLTGFAISLIIALSIVTVSALLRGHIYLKKAAMAD